MLDFRQIPFWLFTLAVFTALLLPTLLQDGMFMDGMLYACVSKNLAEGRGTFWFPHFSQTHYPFFNQQPPLMFGIQAIFSKLFGNSIYIERMYSLLTAIITALLIRKLWRTIFAQYKSMQSISWLPILFWIIIPVRFWSYSNNMEENTMGIFTLSAVYFLYKGLCNEQKIYPYLFISGILLFLGSLCKGFPAFFPLSMIFFHWLLFQKFSFKKTFLYSSLLIAIPITIYALILLYPPAYKGLSDYFFNRVAHSLQSVSTVENRFYILGRLFMELLPVIGLMIILLTVLKIKSFPLSNLLAYRKNFLLFILLGIAGSFPLMVTLEQSGFYLVASLPMFAIALAIIVAPGITALTQNIQQNSSLKAGTAFSLLLFIGTLSFSFTKIGKISRDHELIHDIHLMGKVIPYGSVISIDNSLYTHWSLGEYFIRHYYISVDANNEHLHPYFLIEKNKQHPALAAYEKLNLDLLSFDLYKKIQ